MDSHSFLTLSKRFPLARLIVVFTFSGRFFIPSHSSFIFSTMSCSFSFTLPVKSPVFFPMSANFFRTFSTLSFMDFATFSPTALILSQFFHIRIPAAIAAAIPRTRGPPNRDTISDIPPANDCMEDIIPITALPNAASFPMIPAIIPATFTTPNAAKKDPIATAATCIFSAFLSHQSPNLANTSLILSHIVRKAPAVHAATGLRTLSQNHCQSG